MNLELPTLEQIDIKNKDDIKNLPETLIKARIGSRPLVFNLKILTKEQLNNFLDFLCEIIKKLHIHPHFPYPIYILSQIIKNHPTFKIIQNIDECPKHFSNIQDRKLLHKEIILMQKIYLENQKILSLPLYEIHESMINLFSQNHILRNKTDELIFYNKIAK